MKEERIMIELYAGIGFIVGICVLAALFMPFIIHKRKKEREMKKRKFKEWEDAVKKWKEENKI